MKKKSQGRKISSWPRNILEFFFFLLILIILNIEIFKLHLKLSFVHVQCHPSPREQSINIFIFPEGSGLCSGVRGPPKEGEGSDPGAGNCGAVSYSWNSNQVRRNKDWLGIERKKWWNPPLSTAPPFGGFHLINSTLDKSEKRTLWHPSGRTEMCPVFWHFPKCFSARVKRVKPFLGPRMPRQVALS